MAVPNDAPFTRIEQTNLVDAGDSVKKRSKWISYFGSQIDGGKNSADTRTKLSNNVYAVSDDLKKWALAMQAELAAMVEDIDADDEEAVDAAMRAVGLSTYKATMNWTAAKDRRRYVEMLA